MDYWPEVAHILNHFFLVETEYDSEKSVQFSTQLKANFTELGLGGLWQVTQQNYTKLMLLENRSDIFHILDLISMTASSTVHYTIAFYEWFYSYDVHRYAAVSPSTYWIRRCSKLGFVLLIPFARITRHYGNFIPFIWYPLVPITVSHLSDAFVLSHIRRLSSKSRTTKSPYTLYRRPLAAG